MSDVLRCPSCGQSNRIPPLPAGQKAICGSCKSPLEAPNGDGHPVVLTEATLKGFVSRGPTIVDFWAPWCGPCRMIAPVLEQIAADRRDLQVGKLNVDENPRASSAFDVHGIPLLVFFRDGVERGRLVGAVPKSQIEAAIRQYLS